MGDYSKLPTKYLTDYSYTSPNITLPLASLPGLTEANGDEVTGDIAEILFAALNRIYDIYKVDTAPTKWSIARSTRTNETTNKNTVSFTVQFTTTVGSQTVDDEA